MVRVALAELPGLVGREIAVSDWVTIDQQRIDQFAAATGDHQWIHVDAQRAAATPYGGTIAHGFLTLSLIAGLRMNCLQITDATMSVNYGLNRVRFPAPVPVGGRVRARFALAAVEPVAQDCVQCVWDVVVELEGSAKPACVAQTVSRLFS
jgi:acyl dehydratase